MAHADDTRNDTRNDMQRSSNSLEMQAPAKAWKAERRISREQEQADFAAWLREYRRWTQSGSCAPARVGEIEWGGESVDARKG